MQKFTLTQARKQFPKSFLLVTQNSSVIGIYRKQERAEVRAAKKPHTRIVPPADAWINEDELPKGYPYDEMFQHSKLGQDGLGGVRIFPKLD